MGVSTIIYFQLGLFLKNHEFSSCVTTHRYPSMNIYELGHISHTRRGLTMCQTSLTIEKIFSEDNQGTVGTQANHFRERKTERPL
jgi:hypothetical protein